MSRYFYGKQIIYNYGDVEATDSSVNGTKLKLKVPEGYFSGDDYVSIEDGDFKDTNILDSASIFGLDGAIPTHEEDKTTSLVSKSGTTLKLKAPEGYYDGTISVKTTDANFIAENIKKGVTLFGLDGNLIESGGGIWATGQTSSNSEISGDDGDTERGVVFDGEDRFTANIDGTVTDNFTGLVWVENLLKVGMDGTIANVYKGVWSENSVTYAVGDAVSYPPTINSWWQEGKNYVVGDRIMGEWGSDIFKCIKDHTSNLDNIPPWGAEVAEYWEIDNYPGPSTWQTEKSYIVGDIVSYSQMEYRQNYICTKSHTSSWQNAPSEYEGPTLYWAEIGNKFVCNQAHTSDLTKHCFNSNYWSELPFVSYHQNLDNYRDVSVVKAFYIANNINFGGFTWAIPNIIELLTIVDYGKTNTPRTSFPGIINRNTNEYFSSTKASEYNGMPEYLRVNFSNCEVKHGNQYQHSLILLKTGIKQ